MDFTVTLNLPGAEASEVISGSFRPEESTLLAEFCTEVDRLVDTEWFRTEARVHLEVKGNAAGIAGVEVSLPPEDATAAFLHRIRPFVLQNEELFLPKVAKVLKRRLAHPVFQDLIQQQSDRFNGRDFQRQMTISANGVVLNSEAIVQKWCNAFEYHRDREKQDELSELHKIMPLEAGRALFLSMMIDKASAIVALVRVVRFLGGESGDSLQFAARNPDGDNAA